MKKIKRATITCVALCRRGKNGLKTLFKSTSKDAGTLELATMVKADKIAQGELLAVVYAPNKPDADGDFADHDVIKSMQRGYMRDHQTIDIEHDGKTLTKDQAYLAESFLIAKGDERFADWKNYDGTSAGDLTGAWAVVYQIEDPALRKAFGDGVWDGVSLFGTAAVEEVSDTKAASQRVAERLREALSKQKDIDMDKTELEALLKSFKAEIIALLPKAPVAKAEAATIEPPAFEGDATNPDDLRKFHKALQAFELKKAMAEGKLTAQQVAEMATALEEVAPTDKEANIEKGDTKEVKELKRKLHKAQKRTNAPERMSKGSDDGDDSEEALRKANIDEGAEIAKIHDARRGFANK